MSDAVEVKKRPLGRKPKWKDPEVRDLIVDAVEKGNYLYVAAAAAGIAYNTLFLWLQQAEEPDAPEELVEFAARMYQARATAERVGVEHLWEVARGGHLVKRRVFYDKQGNEVIEEEYTPPTAQPVQFLLERGFSARWGRRATLSVDVDPDAPPRATEAAGAVEGGNLEDIAARLAVHLGRQQAIEAGDDDVVDGEVVEDVG